MEKGDKWVTGQRRGGMGSQDEKIKESDRWVSGQRNKGTDGEGGRRRIWWK